jgi:hypothetical protein
MVENFLSKIFEQIVINFIHGWLDSTKCSTKASKWGEMGVESAYNLGVKTQET